MPTFKKRPQVQEVTPAKEVYYLIYKPYGMLSQFSKENEKSVTLMDLEVTFGKDVYPVGRLDAESEGLLILTNDKSLNAHLLNPKNAHQRTYCVQVDGDVTEGAVKQLQKGVTITVDGKPYATQPCKATKLPQPPALPDRYPPVRYRATIPTSWIEITLIEGKNHQVRKMCAKVGFPVLRLVRTKIGKLEVWKMRPGEVKELTVKEVYLATVK